MVPLIHNTAFTATQIIFMLNFLSVELSRYRPCSATSVPWIGRYRPCSVTSVPWIGILLIWEFVNHCRNSSSNTVNSSSAFPDSSHFTVTPAAFCSQLVPSGFLKFPRYQWRRSGVFIVWKYFTPCSSVSIVNFEHVIVSRERKRSQVIERDWKKSN